MKIFFTGGSGFIALPIVRKLLEKGHHVKVLDLRKPALEHKNLEFVKKSVNEDIIQDIKGCDYVMHFAAILGVDNSDNHPLDTMRVNLEGSVNVFKSAIKAGARNMIYSSSSEVYGEPRELPIREDSTKGPVSTYGVSKLAAEMYARAYNQEFGTDIKIVKELAGSKSEIIKVGFGKETRLKEREIEYRIPDISKIKTLGWGPKTC